MFTSFYFSKFISSDDIDYQSEVFMEGLNVSIPLFLACWIISYTLIMAFKSSNQINFDL